MSISLFFIQSPDGRCNTVLVVRASQIFRVGLSNPRHQRTREKQIDPLNKQNHRILNVGL